MVLYNCSKGIAGKEIEMENEEMNLAELLKDTAEENQTRKILAILEESKDLQEAKEKEVKPASYLRKNANSWISSMQRHSLSGWTSKLF